MKMIQEIFAGILIVMSLFFSILVILFTAAGDDYVAALMRMICG